MAGETQKTSALTSLQATPQIVGEARIVKGRMVVAKDFHQFAAATELEAADVLLTAITIPSNAVVDEIAIYNDDMDTNGSPTLTLDIGLFAAQAFTSITSAVETRHAVDAVLDADAYVDGDTTAQAATTTWTALGFDTATFGPDDANDACWEVLGYDEDPQVNFRVGVTSAAASATLGAAADFGIRVTYTVS